MSNMKIKTKYPCGFYILVLIKNDWWKKEEITFHEQQLQPCPLHGKKCKREEE